MEQDVNLHTKNFNLKPSSIQQGLNENWQQFVLLVLINALVGGMIGMERSIFPEYADKIFGIASKTALLSFIVAFGLTKAFSNYLTGKLANRLGRKTLLLAGWLVALPVPWILMYASNWNWVIFANVLLGLSQGLAWSSTVVMKIDLVGEKNRGLAMGLNEFSGYFAVGFLAFLSAYLAHRFGISPYPFYLGVVISVLGLVLTTFFIRDTSAFVYRESETDQNRPLKNVFIQTSFRDKTLSSVTQAGVINNLNDGMIWGLLPVVLNSLHFDMASTGSLAAIYPGVWGVAQLFTGKLADVYSRKSLLFWGMLLQGIAILFIPSAETYFVLALLSAILGLGTAMVYPTFLTTIAHATTPEQRAESMGVFRLWRDLGYAFGAILSGITADLWGMNHAIWLIGALTVFSAWVIQIRMPSNKQNLYSWL
jgi:MFS family permease